MLELYYFLGALALAVVVYVVYSRKQKQLMGQALELTCLLCESMDLDLLSEPGEEERYRCHSCGYHTDLAAHSGTAALVHTFRDIKRAAEYLREAQDLLDGPTIGIVATRAVGMDHEDERNAEINRLRSNALSILGDLTRRHPGLLEIPRIRESDPLLRRLEDQLPLPLDHIPTDQPSEAELFHESVLALEAFRDDYARYVLDRGVRT